MDSFDSKRLYESIKLVLDLGYKIESLHYDSGSFGNFVVVLQKDKKYIQIQNDRGNKIFVDKGIKSKNNLQWKEIYEISIIDNEYEALKKLCNDLAQKGFLND